MAEIEYPPFVEVVAMSAVEAKTFFGRTDDPTDLGPANPLKYKDGARVWGFPTGTKESAEEKAKRIWCMERR